MLEHMSNLCVSVCVCLFLAANVLRESEKKEDDVYEDLPLFIIERDYGGTAAGKNLGSIYHVYPSIHMS